MIQLTIQIKYSVYNIIYYLIFIYLSNNIFINISQYYIYD